MNYISTRNRELATDAPGAVLAGIAPDGGLFTPDILPFFWHEDINLLCTLPYYKAAAFILSRFMEGYSLQELEKLAKEAYGGFAHPDVAPLSYAGENTWSLELFHGPTCAFKDFALQMLPRFLVSAAEKKQSGGETVILVATSGDTGKAALEGFKNVKGTKIGVFYPDGGVSQIQRKQMTTQEGENVAVFAIKGNFDDAQRGVKNIFADKELKERLCENGISLSSANSINWGRLAPQIVYYFRAYTSLVNSGKIKIGDKVDFCVPTGNFGNILAGYIAKKSGLPIERLICASNKNNVLTDFFATGIYDRNRELYKTGSPSMDILVSSNLERLLFMLSDDKTTRSLMEQLNKTGRYEIDTELRKKLIDAGFSGFYADDNDASAEIKYRWEKYGYLCDPHTAVAMKAARLSGTDNRPMIVASTASPFKFANVMLEALTGEICDGGIELLERLESLTGHKAPLQLMEVENKKERFCDVIAKEDMSRTAEKWMCAK